MEMDTHQHHIVSIHGDGGDGGDGGNDDSMNAGNAEVGRVEVVAAAGDDDDGGGNGSKKKKNQSQARQSVNSLFHCMTIDECESAAQTNRYQGLSVVDAHTRLQRDGKNVLKQSGAVRWYMVLLRHVFNFMTLVLLSAMIIALAVQEWIDAAVVAFVIILNTVIGFVQEMRSEKAMEALRKMSSSSTRVMRGDASAVQIIPAAEVVCGDIVLLEQGDNVPADIRLFEVHGLECDEAILTGESMPVAKQLQCMQRADTPLGDRTCLAFSGTAVSKGKGRGIVMATGMDTQIGAIARSLNNAKKQQPKLQKRMNMLGLVLVIAAVCCIGIVVGAYMLYGLGSITQALQAGVSTAVAIIPEGLVPVLTLTMTFGVMKMVKQNVLVRKLASLESLGSVTNICSDKTGTLTEGKMTATDMWVAGAFYTVSSGSGSKGKVLESSSKTAIGTSSSPLSAAMKLTFTIAALCNSASVKRRAEMAPPVSTAADGSVALDIHNEEEKKSKKSKKSKSKSKSKSSATTQLTEWVTVGSPTEVALQVLAMKVKMGSTVLRKREYRDLVIEHPFDSSIKRMSVVYKRIKGDSEALVLCKGAPERMVSLCTQRVFDSEGNIAPMDDKFEETVHHVVQEMALKGLRVLCLAYKTIYTEQYGDGELVPIVQDREALESQLTFVGLVGIMDPPRRGVSESVAQCHRAGIAVHMCTGDHQSTAMAIARQIGILPEGEVVHEGDSDGTGSKLVMSATEFDRMSREELKKLKQLPLVIARCSPETKVKMIEALHDRGLYCAMTGDGVNDSPAIKSADVGIAMGIAGSDVTKSAADLILTDDSFSSIVHAIREGRRIFASIRKFVIHLLSGNVSEAIVLVLAVMCGLRPPINSTQVLFLNMITGTAPAIGLGVERAQRGMMDKRQRSPVEALFTWETIVDILFYGALMGLITLLNFLLVDEWWMRLSYPVAQSTAFTTLTILLLLHAYNCRNIRRPFFADGLYNSTALHSAVLFGFACTCAILYIPWVNTVVFHHVPIGGTEWIFVAIGGVVFMLIVEMYKFMKRMLRAAYLKIKPPQWAIEEKRLREEEALKAAELDGDSSDDDDEDEDEDEVEEDGTACQHVVVDIELHDTHATSDIVNNDHGRDNDDDAIVVVGK